MNQKELEHAILNILGQAREMEPKIGRYIDHYLFDDNMITVVISNGKLKIPVTLVEKGVSDKEIARKAIQSFHDLN